MRLKTMDTKTGLKMILGVLVLAAVYLGYILLIYQGTKLKPERLVMDPGASRQLTVTSPKYRALYPSGSLGPVYSTSNPKVVRVSDGKVVAGKEGEALIIVRYLHKTMKCRVTVETPRLSKTEITLPIGESEKLAIKTKRKVQWKVNSLGKNGRKTSSQVISFHDGKITAKQSGDGYIHAIVGGKTYTCHVKVRDVEIAGQPNIEKGKDEVLSLKYAPKDAKVEWKSSQPEIADLVLIPDKTSATTQAASDKNKTNSTTEPSEINATSLDKVKLTGNNVGATDITVKVGKQIFTKKIKIKGDPHLKLEGSDTYVGQKALLKVDHLLKTYKISWVGAKDSGDGTAIFQAQDRGRHEVKAIVDTGEGKYTLKKNILVREKKLNVTEWQGKRGQELALTMQDSEEPQIAYDQSMLTLADTQKGQDGNTIWTFRAVGNGSSKIGVTDKGQNLECSVNIDGSIMVDAMSQLMSGVTSHHFHYGNSGVKSTYESALSSNKITNCAAAVSWAMQKAGYLGSGAMIYYEGGLQGDTGSLYNNPNIEISYPNKPVSSCNLSSGDVCGFTLEGNTPHMAVFVGRDAQGDAVWLTAGKDATDGGVFKSLSKCGPRRQDYYRNVKVLIHTR